MTMAAMIFIMMAVIVLTGSMGALHPPSNVEVVDPTTLHLQGEFVESNLGTAIERDGTITVRLIAQQNDFVPRCVQVPVGTPVKFRLTSADVVHGFLLPDTNVNTMVVPPLRRRLCRDCSPSPLRARRAEREPASPD